MLNLFSTMVDSDKPYAVSRFEKADVWTREWKCAWSKP